MGIQATGSNTALLLQCPYPFSDVELPPDEDRKPTRYGLAFHRVLQRVVPERIRRAVAGRKARKGDIEEAIPEAAEEHHLAVGQAKDLVDHARAAVKELMRFLRGENAFDRVFLVEGIEVEVEKSWAIVLPSRKSQRSLAYATDPPDEEHVYRGKNVGKGVVPTTLDLAINGPVVRPMVRAWRLIVDYKSGRMGDWSQPAAVPQMQTAAETCEQQDVLFMESYLAVLDANRDGIAAVYMDEADNQGFGLQLRRALALAENSRGGSFMRTGPQCRWCPARTVCPTQTAELLDESTALVRAMEGGLARLATAREDELAPAQKVGILHELFSKVNKLRARVAPDMRRFVEEYPDFVSCPDGQVLILETREVERIAGKGGYVETLGKVEAERRFEQLRAEGLMKTSQEVHLRAVPNERASR